MLRKVARLAFLAAFVVAVLEVLDRFVFRPLGLGPHARDPFLDQQATEDNVEIVLRGPTGQVKQRLSAHNLVTTVGKEKLAEQLVAAPATEKPKYIAIGSGATAAAAGDTTLQTELKRKEATTRNAAGKVLTMAVVFAAGEGTGEVKEAGILSANAAVSLYARLVFSVINKGAEDSLEITWKLEYP